MAGRDRDDMEVLILESDEIWQSLRRALGSFIRHRVGNLEDAEDILQEVLDSNMASPEDEPDADAGRRLAGCLAAMIDELPAPYREAITLVEQDGMTQREYAARCGLSVSGAKARVQRARKKLKAKLLGCCRVELDRLGTIIDYQYLDDLQQYCQRQHPSVPPKAMIIEAVLREVFSPEQGPGEQRPTEFELPANLKRFFADRDGCACCGLIRPTGEKAS